MTRWRRYRRTTSAVRLLCPICVILLREDAHGLWCEKCGTCYVPAEALTA